MLSTKTNFGIDIIRRALGVAAATCLVVSPQLLQAQAPTVTEGLFDQEMPSIAASPPCCVQLDVDGDGQPEAVMTGDGLPGTVTAVSIGTGGTDVIVVGVAGGGEIVGTLDLDGDGNLEALVLADGLATDVVSGSAGSSLDVVFARRGTGGEYLGAVDLDGDGEPEAIVRDPSLAVGMATTEDVDGDDPDVLFVGGAASSVFRYGDVDGDGDVEVLLGDTGVSPGTASTSHDADSDGDGDVRWLGGELLDVVDLDGDGELEALVLDAGQAWYGTASLGGTAPDAVFVDVSAYAGVLDVDGDGELEAVFEEVGLANGTFPTEALSGVDVDLMRIGVASGGKVAGRVDVDGDGELELIVEDPTQPDTVPLTGASGGTAPDVVFLGGSGNIQALADTDGNGQLEIFVQRQRSPRGALIYSLPGSLDVDYVLIDNPDPQGKLRAVNLDGDNETEVVVETDNLGLAAASRARTHFGTANDADIVFMGTPGATFVGLADLDGDGDTEAVYEASTLDVLDSRAALYATPKVGFVFIGTDAGTASVVGLADANGDGADQLILETSDGSLGAVQTDTLQGLTVSAIALATSTGGAYGGAADLDGDGDDELLFEDPNLAAALVQAVSIDGTDPDVVNLGAMGGGAVLCGKDLNSDGNPEVLVREPSLISGIAQTADVGGVDPTVVFVGTALASDITLLTPNGGGSHVLYTSVDVTWSAPNLSGRVKIELSGDDGATWQVLKETTDNDGHWSWLVKEAPTTLGRLRLSSVDDAAETDVSDGTFTIPTPSVTLLEPNGGETWPIDTPQTIRWQMDNIAGPARLEISYDGGATWSEHLAQVNNSGQAGWWPTPPVGSDVRFRVASFHDPSYQDAGDGSFEVPQPQITVLSPNGGESLVIDALSLLTWQTADVGGALRIELSRDGGLTWEEISAAVLDDGSHRPRIPGPATSAALLRVSQSKYPQFFDVSDAFFSVVP